VAPFNYFRLVSAKKRTELLLRSATCGNC